MDASLHARFLRTQLAERRLGNILRAHTIANSRTLEQKISDSGPSNQRIDPHVLTVARRKLEDEGVILQTMQGGVPWFHLSNANPQAVASRLSELLAVHGQTQRSRFKELLGQALEIAVFRALLSQTALPFLGSFTDLDAHDDATRYSKEEPPSSLSGRRIPNDKRLDFILTAPASGGTYAGVEIKNIREWLYPDRPEIREFLFKCCALDVVPVLIARRIHYSTFSVLNPCGVVLHQTYNQLYPESARALADSVREKLGLGYHDVRVGNQPDRRLIKFVHHNLAAALPPARPKFDAYKDLLSNYADGTHNYKSFAARVKRRMKGLPEDLPPFEPEEPPDDFPDFPDEAE